MSSISINSIPFGAHAGWSMHVLNSWDGQLKVRIECKSESKCLNHTILMSKLASSRARTGLSHISQGTLLARIFQFPIKISEPLTLSLVGIFLREKTVVGNLPRLHLRDSALGSRSCGPVTQCTSDYYTANSADPAAVLLDEISFSSKQWSRLNSRN
jgi:hypothetical protein